MDVVNGDVAAVTDSSHALEHQCEAGGRLDVDLRLAPPVTLCSCYKLREIIHMENLTVKIFKLSVSYLDKI